MRSSVDILLLVAVWPSSSWPTSRGGPAFILLAANPTFSVSLLTAIWRSFGWHAGSRLPAVISLDIVS